MSTRVRILFKTPDNFVYYGSRAVKYIIALGLTGKIESAVPRMLKIVPGVTKTDKLLYLADKFPLGYEMALFTEPRGTRSSRSRYCKTRRKELPFNG